MHKMTKIINKKKRKQHNPSAKTGEKMYAASYTIETACVMAVFCMALVVLIQQAYRLHDETKSGMVLQLAVEQARHQEDESTEEPAEGFGLMFSMEDASLQIEEGLNRVNGHVQALRGSSGWSLEISQKKYEPEEFLRQIAALKQLEERDEGKLQAGDAAQLSDSGSDGG